MTTLVVGAGGNVDLVGAAAEQGSKFGPSKQGDHVDPAPPVRSLQTTSPACPNNNDDNDDDSNNSNNSTVMVTNRLPKSPMITLFAPSSSPSYHPRRSQRTFSASLALFRVSIHRSLNLAWCVPQILTASLSAVCPTAPISFSEPRKGRPILFC